METRSRLGVGKQIIAGLIRSARLALLTLVLGVAALFIWQDKLLWHPRPYARGEVENFSRRLVQIPFRTAQGKQAAFYAPSSEDRNPSNILASLGGSTPGTSPSPQLDRAALPTTLWVVFAGNGSLVLDWDDILRDQSDPGAAFLLVDYPGYGFCEGNPSPGSIRDNTAGAMDALARRLGGTSGADLMRAMTADGRKLGVLAQSIGTGPGEEFAVTHPEVSKVVLVSPYTSLRDAARGVVGWPLCLLLRGNFDNAARLDALAKRAVPPDVRIFHGDKDTLVSVVQGRALAAAHPSFVRFTLVPGAGHNDTVDLARSGILAALDGR